ncbi:hypothetical protein [Chelativorans sp. YIM 93263]|uniref:hypothetical protein n=1 Tax=Chelativorans sp. YIM 93263 TaxID=2906648 RepID=UPI002378043C|nr:hypothetical protein [Chelativorans sp. YIM 93263]
MHERTAIRNSALSILDDAAPPGWTLRKGRGRAVSIEECPVLELAIPNEPTQRGAQRKRREPVLTVTTYIAEGEDGDTASDDAAVWIEAALDADPTLGGVCQDATHANTEIAPYAGGETPVWEMTLTYNLRVS